MTCEHQLLAAKVPDVLPSTVQSSANFSMAAGDFLKVYTEPDEWDCVATCFFIDCAPNVIEFVESIYNILRPGGFWINLGPLLYHYSDIQCSEDTIEPPYDILRDIITDVGFVIVKEKTAVKTKYAQNPNSMLQHEYNSVFFVCQKPATIDTIFTILVNDNTQAHTCVQCLEGENGKAKKHHTQRRRR
ncbi:Carnosine N-methyltransferase [Eumeta japonica]|uniref:carnosine N-methyltransferase n=1 Tax=Eumeta variegata TaxID=151549 RepID=A0A4C1YBK5_EUMVA|nr:Carnosine N-methyltransferase [Eumeta japonica]